MEGYPHEVRSEMALHVLNTLGIIEDCAICGEPVTTDAAEMFEPGGEAHLVHVDCGILKGWEVA